MFELLFWGTIIWLVVWLARRDGRTTEVDYESKSYAQGYWDGYRAHQKAIQNGEPDQVEPRLPEVPGDTVYSETAKADPVVMREKNHLQNINLTLYIASFLLVAAAALFIGTALPGVVKFVAVWIVTASFYGVGLWLHTAAPRLRPAALAFVGTGLALLPFAGWATYRFFLPDASLCWLMTSIIGLIAFVIAALKLQSQIVAYFAIAFVVSLLSSGVATLDSALKWYFVIVIAFGSFVTMVAAAKPDWLPAVFSRPIEQSSQWLVPLTLTASLVMAGSLSLTDYVVISGVTTLYYAAVSGAAGTGSARLVNALIGRIMASIFVVLVAYDTTDSWVAVSWSLAVVGVIQTLASGWLVKFRRLYDATNWAWIWGGLGLIVIAPYFALGSDSWAAIASWQVGLLLVVSGLLAAVLHRAEPLYFGIYALLVLPLLVGFGVIEPAVQAHWIALWYMGLSGISLYIRAFGARVLGLKAVLIVGYVAFLAAALLCTGALHVGWNAVVWLVVSGILYAAVIIEKRYQLTLLANICFVVAASWLVSFADIQPAWSTLMVGWIALASFYGGYVFLRSRSKLGHARLMLLSAIVSGGFFALINFDNYPSDIVIAAAATMVLVALLVAYEGTHRSSYRYYDVAALLATIGLQRLVSVVFLDVNLLIYTHWWALVLIGLAYLYYTAGNRQQAKYRLIGGLVMVSLFSGVMALSDGYGSDDVPYRLLFLIEHAALLIIGLRLASRLLTIWGAVGVVLAVLWMLSGYTFLLLLFIGLLLIAFAVYSLMKQSRAGVGK